MPFISECCPPVSVLGIAAKGDPGSSCSFWALGLASASPSCPRYGMGKWRAAPFQSIHAELLSAVWKWASLGLWKECLSFSLSGLLLTAHQEINGFFHIWWACKSPFLETTKRNVGPVRGSNCFRCLSLMNRSRQEQIT